MTYIKDIPQNLPPGTEIVDQIRENFSEYATVFGNNHIAINSRNQGAHDDVVLQEQLINPVVDSNFSDLFSKNVTLNSLSTQQLFSMVQKFIPDQNNDPVQLTFSTVKTTAQYQTFLPGGYVVYFDTIPSAATINVQVTLVPTPAEILCVIPNPTRIVGLTGLVSGPLRISVTIDAADKFTIKASAPFAPNITGAINWIAIARQKP